MEVIKEENEISVISFKNDRMRPFVSNGKELYSIKVGNGYEYVRPKDKVFASREREGYSCFNIRSDYEITLKRNVKRSDGTYKTEKTFVKAAELQEMHNRYDKQDEFIKISISKNQVVQKFVANTEDGSKEFSRILAPQGITYLRRSEQLHSDNDNSNNLYFYLHKSNKIKVQSKDTDTVIGTTESGKPIYATVQKEVTANELKQMYEDGKRAWKEQNDKAREAEQPGRLGDSHEAAVYIRRGI